MKKFALIIEKFTDNSIGGEPAIHSNFVEFLRNQNYLVDVFCEKDETKSIQEGINVFSNFNSNKENYLEKINKTNYDIIFSSRFGLKFEELKADIYSIHSHSDKYSQQVKYGWLYNLIKPKQKRIKNEIKNLNANKGASFIFCSNQLKNDYLSLINGDIQNILVVNPYPNCLPINDIRKEYNAIFTFGLSATGFQNKGGYLTLFSAFLLKFFVKNFKLKIIYKAKAGLLQKLQIFFLGLNNQVEFLPKQEDMHEFYSSIDCLLVPSQLESFGMVTVEAIRFGLPVIISSTCGSTEIISDKFNGCIFKFNVFKAFNLASKMKYILDKNNLEKLKANVPLTIINNKENYNETLLNKCLKVIQNV